jgi:hypothetical protein
VIDIFEVPDRTLEVIDFGFSAVGMACVVAGIMVLDSNLQIMAILLSMVAFSAFLLARGLRQRKHRLDREREVQELKADILGRADG